MIDPRADGAWNMAVDAVMLQQAASAGDWTLRFYRWTEPTLSLGYFQAHRDRGAHLASRDLPFVRRPSGGGAIVHDQELTYSLAGPVPSGHAGTQRLYWTVHTAWVEVLAALGVEAHLCQVACHDANQPFLCFERRAAGDVLVGGAKVAGSAQRRRGGVVLQHGSILLGTSAAAPELPGIASLTRQAFAFPTWIDLALGRLGRALRFHFDRGRMSDLELAQVATLAHGTFGQPAWNERR